MKAIANLRLMKKILAAPAVVIVLLITSVLVSIIGASEQISKNIEAISSVTQESASGTQQIARAAEDLNRLTQNLEDLLQKFTLTAETTTVTILKKAPAHPTARIAKR